VDTTGIARRLRGKKKERRGIFAKNSREWRGKQASENSGDGKVGFLGPNDEEGGAE